MEKLPKYEFKQVKIIIIKVDLRNTLYLKTAIIESECNKRFGKDI